MPMLAEGSEYTKYTVVEWGAVGSASREMRQQAAAKELRREMKATIGARRAIIPQFSRD